MNCYHNSPIDLANQIYGRTRQAGIGTVTYTCTGVAAITGNIVCMGQMQDGKYITNPAQGAPRQFVDALTPQDILMFLIKYGAWLKDPLLMFGVWHTLSRQWCRGLRALDTVLIPPFRHRAAGRLLRIRL